MGLLPLSATASLLLVLSSLSMQAAALQSRSQVLAGERLRQVEDQLMSAAQQFVAAQHGPVAYRLVELDGPHWQPQPDAGAPQTGRAELTLELLPTAEQPRPHRAAFALELMRHTTAEGQASPQVRALRELGLRGRAAQEVAP